METRAVLKLLGGLSPARFMAVHWQNEPLLVRGAVADVGTLPRRAELFRLAADDAVESRLLRRSGSHWTLQQGPFARRTLPRLADPGWTLLVQGVDLHHAGARALLDHFRFIPDARVDDVMISYASAEGGVGPHFDSYDVFLIQLCGQRRWRIGRQDDLDLRPGLPLRILKRFTPEQEWVLAPGDMLYLPPRWAHDGVAVGADCMTCSVGFRAPARLQLAGELLGRIADHLAAAEAGALYSDAQQPAVDEPAAIPRSLIAFAHAALHEALAVPQLLDTVLGEWLTEPKPDVWFDARRRPSTAPAPAAAIVLDRRTRMLYDEALFFINGECFHVDVADRAVLRRLANQRALAASDVTGLAAASRALIDQWMANGWLHERI